MGSRTSANVDISKFMAPDKVKATRLEMRQKRSDSAFLEMLEDGVHADITIAAQGGTVKAHRCVLASVSPVFHAMFRHDMKEQLTSTVEIPDMTIDVLQLFLLFLYTTADTIETMSTMLSAAIDKHFVEFYSAVCKYNVESRLRNVLMPSLLRNLTPENCWDYYDCPLQAVAGDNDAVSFPVCDWYILGKYNEVVQSESVVVEMRRNPERVRSFMLSAESQAAREAALESYDKATKEFESIRWHDVKSVDAERMRKSAGENAPSLRYSVLHYLHFHKCRTVILGDIRKKFRPS